ncbi:MAG: phytoene desaturase family protein [Thermomicrobiaceae bacterium]
MIATDQPDRTLTTTETGGPETRPRAIVVGAGFGGLAAAIRLAAGGYRVSVVEARHQPGGRAGQIVDQGFTFDTGPTLITVPELLEDLWKAAGKRLEDYVSIQQLEPYYRIQFKDGRTFEYSGDPDQFDKQIASFNPDDVEGYRRFLEATRNVYQRAFVDLGRAPFHRFTSFLKVVPELIRLGGLRSVYDFASRYINDPYLRTVLSFHPLFIGGNPFRASAIYSIVPYLEKQGGVHFASGGMYSIISAMVKLIEELGGEVLLNTPVRKFVSAHGRIVGVETESGTMLGAEVVVANSDAANTLLNMVPKENQSRLWSGYWKRSRHSMSCFLLYVGLSRQYPELRHHTIVMPRDFRRVVTDIFDVKRIPTDLPMYIHTPSRTDPSMAPPGCESMYILVPVPNLSSGIDWSYSGDDLRERVLDALENELGLEGFRDSVVVEHRFTPDDFKGELRSWLGAAFSIEPTLTQSAYFRPHNQVSEIDGLYLVGAGTHPGAGVPGVLLSAEIATRLILDRTSSSTGATR